MHSNEINTKEFTYETKKVKKYSMLPSTLASCTQQPPLPLPSSAVSGFLPAQVFLVPSRYYIRPGATGCDRSTTKSNTACDRPQVSRPEHGWAGLWGAISGDWWGSA